MKTEHWNWSDLRVFLAVVREGSTLAASRKLGIAQPTVARRIEQLEHQADLTLFVRDTRGFQPTAQARDLMPLAEAVEQACAAFAAKSQELAKPRPIRITAPSYFTDPSMEIFSAFAASHPGVELEFLLGVGVLNLLEGEADVAFRVTMTEPDESLIGRKIGTEHFALYGGHRYADSFGLPKSPDDFRGHRFVTFRREDAADDLSRWIQRHVQPDQIVDTFSDLEMLHAAIKAGRGLGLVHARWADTDRAFLRCFDNIAELSRPFMMLIGPEAYQRPEVKAFVRFVAPRYAARYAVQAGH